MERPSASLEPNSFELRGDSIQITYSTGSGQRLIYQEPVRVLGDEQRRLIFSGEEIHLLVLEIGKIVHVLLERASDGDYMLDVLLPNFYPNLRRSEEPEEWRFNTLAILTTTVGGIVPPHLRTGPVQNYEVLQLQGTARLVESWVPTSELFKRWVRSHEEDTEDVEVYRTTDFDFPPSWPRPGFEIKETGEFVEYVPADDDRGVVRGRVGRWEAEGENQIEVHFDGSEPDSYTLDIVSYEERVLRIRR